MHDASTHYSPRTIHHLPLAVHYSPRIMRHHHAPLATRCALLASFYHESKGHSIVSRRFTLCWNYVSRIIVSNVEHLHQKSRT